MSGRSRLASLWPVPTKIQLQVKRQDSPVSSPYWEDYEIPYQPRQNVISVLMEIAKDPKTREGKPTSPVVYDRACLEEVCGSCAMRINGVSRMACTALVDSLRIDFDHLWAADHHARDQHEGQQHEPKDVERWSNIQQLAIIGEGDGEHRYQGNRQADQLLDPEIFRGLGVTNLQRAEADDADGKDGQQPVEISKRPFF